jgi:hypothetical protein
VPTGRNMGRSYSQDRHACASETSGDGRSYFPVTDVVTSQPSFAAVLPAHVASGHDGPEVGREKQSRSETRASIRAKES